jgi:hypothetical protein
MNSRSSDILRAGGRFPVLCALVFGLAFSTISPAAAQKPKPLKNGDVLSGELTAMWSGPRKKRVVTYQLTSEPRQLAAPGGMCNLETGPETFQIVTSDAAEIAALKQFLGKTVALRVEEMSCANAAGQLSDAIVSKWSLLTKR